MPTIIAPDYLLPLLIIQVDAVRLPAEGFEQLSALLHNVPKLLHSSLQLHVLPMSHELFQYVVALVPQGPNAPGIDRNIGQSVSEGIGARGGGGKGRRWIRRKQIGCRECLWVNLCCETVLVVWCCLCCVMPAVARGRVLDQVDASNKDRAAVTQCELEATGVGGCLSSTASFHRI